MGYKNGASGTSSSVFGNTSDSFVGIDNRHSVLRQVMEGAEWVNLETIRGDVIVVPGDFYKRRFETNDLDTARKRSLAQELVSDAEAMGFSENLFTGVLEAIRNAVQHGNGYDPFKLVEVASRIGEAGAEFIIQDQAEKIRSAALPFILRHHMGLERHVGHVDFYEFSGAPRTEENSGIGIRTMYTVFDDVQFGLGDLGGLAVYLGKFR